MRPTYSRLKKHDEAHKIEKESRRHREGTGLSTWVQYSKNRTENVTVIRSVHALPNDRATMDFYAKEVVRIPLGSPDRQNDSVHPG